MQIDKLNIDTHGMGERIRKEHKCFEGCENAIWNEKTGKHNINYILDHLLNEKQISSEEFDDLKHWYGKNHEKEDFEPDEACFRNEYQKIIKNYIGEIVKYDDLIVEIKEFAVRTELYVSKSLGLIENMTKEIRESNSKLGDDENLINDFWSDQLERIPKILAQIFALWTLKKSKYFFSNLDSANQESYLKQPHAGQVIAIYRLLGIANKEKKLSNHLVQLGTGEGKSVVLAVSAIALALLGFDVSVACYSDYLSRRDNKQFKKIFKLLGVDSNIYYGTFNDICEKLINEDGDVRKRVEKLITEEEEKKNEDKKEEKDVEDNKVRPKVLLVDEVDVFLHKDFYGNTYTPSAILKHKTINELAKYIWNESKIKNKLNYWKIKESNEFKECCAHFKKWDFLVDTAVKEMIIDIQHYKEEESLYKIQDDKIFYIEQDGLSEKVRSRYRTMFSYFYEEERKKISQKKCWRQYYDYY